MGNAGKMGRGFAPFHLPRTSTAPPRSRGGVGEGTECEAQLCRDDGW